MRSKLALTAMLFVTVASSSHAEPSTWELPIIREFLVCEGQLAGGCERFSEGKFAQAYAMFADPGQAGDPAAQNNVGVLYETGAGLPESKEDALIWYGRAAQQGLPMAQYNLGALLAADHLLGTANPDRMEIDLVTAYQCFTLAERQGLAIARDAKRELAQHLTEVQRTQAEQRAQVCRPSADK